MYLLITSIALTVLFAGTVTYFLFKNREILINMTGLSVVMAIAVVTGTNIGMIMAFIFKGQYALSTTIAMALSALAGFLMGKTINLLAVVEAVVSGFMGGMMGAMVGEMLPAQHLPIMLAVFACTFVGVSVFALYVIYMEYQRDRKIHAIFGNAEIQEIRVKPILWAMLVVIPVLLIIASFLASPDIMGREPSHLHHPH